MIITLVGYRATGKTSVAPLLAARLGWNWIDADVEIEARAGKTIKQIFAEDGEPEFRRIERDVMAELLTRSSLVLAAGGGAVLNEQTSREMKAAGPVVWLRASVDTLVERLASDATTDQRRPNLSAQGGRAEIERLLAFREPVYRDCAGLTIDTDGLELHTVVEIIYDAVRGLDDTGA